MVDGKPIQLGLWEAAGGRGDYDPDRLRPLSYPNTNIFLILFSVISLSSFENVATKWVPEISHHCPGVPWILVGTKSDLRNTDAGTIDAQTIKKWTYVTSKAAQEKVRQLNGTQYIECSSVTQTNLKKVFDEAIRYVM